MFKLLTFLVVYQIVKNRSRRQSDSDSKQLHAESPEATSKRESEAHEYNHREDEKVFWKRSLRWSVATSIITLTAVFVAWLSFDDAHEGLIAVQRSFVYVDEPNPPLVLHLTNGIWLYHFTPQWKAIGQTQPVDLRVGASCPLYKIDQLNEPFSFGAKDLFYGKRYAGPGQSISGITCFFPEEYVRLIQTGQYFSPAFVRAEYKDVFGKPHVTERCDLIEGLGEDQLGGRTATGKPNLLASGSPCREHNCVDDQCK